MRTRQIRILAAALSALLSACAASAGRERPLTLPPLTVGSRPHVGSALTGPLAIPASASAAEPLVVHYRAVWVESSVPTTDSLEPHVGLVLGLGDAEPVRPLSRRAGKLGFARGSDAVRMLDELVSGALGRTTTVWDEASAIGVETTLRLDVTAPGRHDEIESFTLESTRAAAGDSARIALQIGPRLDPAQELLVLREPLRAAEGPIALVFRREAQRDEPAALVVLVEIGDGDAPRRSPLAEGDLEASVAGAAERRREFTRAEAERREIQDVAAQLGSPAERRARLVFLASSCGAPLALDVALIARESDLEELADLVRVELERPLNRADAGWRMERSAWLLLGQKSAAGQIAPELSGILTRHGGEAARFPGAIEDLVRGEVSVAGLVKKLTAENRILLEDASPASRLRAYDWLAVRGLAPAGFDPFGTLAERRAALLAAADAEEAAAARTSEAQR